MFIALDIDKKRVHANKAYVNGDYRCPSCGSEMIYKHGRKRRAYFAHRANSYCSDTWHKQGIYDQSVWHDEWQNEYPADNQEIHLTWDMVTHRADILTGRTVIEFQHSSISEERFSERNNFYFNFGYNIIWLFDMREEFSQHKIIQCNDTFFTWLRPYRAFKHYDRYKSQSVLFFQLIDSSNDNKCIVRIEYTSRFGFEEFYISGWYTKQEFLDYTTQSSGNYELPLFYDDLTQNDEFQDFKRKYNIELTKEQDRAVQSVEGAILLLAVPGSGKTTTLIARLGYMIFCKKISPEKILVLSYTNSAADEVRQRFLTTFDLNENFNLRFATINSFCLDVISYHSLVSGKSNPYKLNLRQETLKEMFMSKYRKTLSKSELIECDNIIGYIKNMMLYESEEEITNIDKEDLFSKYDSFCKQNYYMDFDDQLIFAYQILLNRPSVRLYFQEKYHYICVDEAQDNSKQQHEIIKLIAEKNNNILMVGDEDQSIFGFRGAFPRALFKFRSTYKNPFTLQIKRNFRSTGAIIDNANSFIEHNTDREPKRMVTTREKGRSVLIQSVRTRTEQFRYIIDRLALEKLQTAVLTRINDSLIPLIYMLSENNISYSINRDYQITFFGTKAYRDVMNFIKASCNDGRKPSDLIAEYCLDNPITLIMDNLYMISEQYETVVEFTNCLDSLQKEINEKTKTSGLNTLVTLSTIHASKGMEFENVILFDVYDGLLPLSGRKNAYFQSEHEYEQEERRLFYVGMTRAIDQLTIICVNDRETEFIDELVNNNNQIEISNYSSNNDLSSFNDIYSHVYELNKIIEAKERMQKEEAERIKLEQEKQRLIEKTQNDVIRRNVSEEECYKNAVRCFDPKYADFCKTTKVVDYYGRRWMKCIICNEVRMEEEFWTYGGENGMNYGKCKVCNKSK